MAWTLAPPLGLALRIRGGRRGRRPRQRACSGPARRRLPPAGGWGAGSGGAGAAGGRCAGDGAGGRGRRRRTAAARPSTGRSCRSCRAPCTVLRRSASLRATSPSDWAPDARRPQRRPGSTARHASISCFGRWSLQNCNLRQRAPRLHARPARAAAVGGQRRPARPPHPARGGCREGPRPPRCSQMASRPGFTDCPLRRPAGRRRATAARRSPPGRPLPRPPRSPAASSPAGGPTASPPARRKDRPARVVAAPGAGGGHRVLDWPAHAARRTAASGLAHPGRAVRQPRRTPRAPSKNGRRRAGEHLVPVRQRRRDQPRRARRPLGRASVCTAAVVVRGDVDLDGRGERQASSAAA